ncbi:hypothetical protein AVEN_20179-1 [Araneus ventricosus]|uniref:Tc1-like transposase DDE domain-containing protein n=1 Tax=Araneus ventricosus TaxID=182803 RepID=A0A4Y2CK18_ARAVE|nr:hypothetical protein AVEN_20179-1 [Araneus ventricosus]
MPFQHFKSVDRTIFMEDDAPPHIPNPVKRLLRMHFGNDRIISLHFPTNWQPRSPDLNPCDFWLCGWFSETCVQWSGCKLGSSEGTHYETYSQHQHRYIPICCGTCYFSVCTCRRKRCAAY